MGMKNIISTHTDAVAREIADEFCGGSDAVYEVILAKLCAAETRPTVKQAIRWIRKNCQVDTGDGIYGDASRYSYKQIKKAIQRVK